MYGIRHSFAAAEHQQSNGLAEKNNGVLVDRLAAYIAEDPATWDDHLSAAVFAINTSSQASIRTTPFEVCFGILPRLPVEAMLPELPEGDDEESRRRSMERRREVAARIHSAQQRQKENYDRRRVPAQVFDPGYLVLVRRKATKRGIPKKLQPRYVGPFEIERRSSATTYVVRDLQCNRSRTRFCVFAVHTCQLKLWRAPKAAGEDEEEEGGEEDGARVALEAGPPEHPPIDDPDGGEADRAEEDG